MDYYSGQISRLIESLSSLPGIGSKSAQRMAFHILNMPETEVEKLAASILEAYHFTAIKYIEEDGSVTLSLNEIDLVENGADEKAARFKLAESIMEYSLDYYNEYEIYSHSPNRKKHIPYIFKALIIDSPEKLGDMLQCQSGKN